jgi:excisionase family DNA binding protein
MTLPAPPRRESNEPTTQPAIELLTVDEVAALLKVSRSWVYEHTRKRGRKDDQLPHLKLGKFVRFDPRLVRAFLARRTRTA